MFASLAAVPPVVDWPRVFATLPPLRYRRSFFVDHFGGGEFDVNYFVGLLLQIDPARARELRAAPAIEHYRAVIQHCFNSFPCNDGWLYEYEDTGPINFIPCDALGIDPWEDEVGRIGLAVCIVAHRTKKELYTEAAEVFGADDFTCLNKWVRYLPAALGQKRVKAVRLPAGRAWRKPWDGLRDLSLWSNNETGYGILDVTANELGESYSFPDWNAGEIRSLTRQWQRAKPIFDRACDLLDYIDQSPRKRLPLLANALLGDAAALREITFKKRSGQ